MLDSLRAFSRTLFAKIFFAVLILSFALFGRVDTCCKQLSSAVPALACSFQRHLRILTEADELLSSANSIPQAPQLRTLRHHKQVQTITVVELAWLLSCLSVANRRVG